MKLSTIAGLLLSMTLVQGCNAGPDTPRPINNKSSEVAGKATPTSSAKTKDEQFAQLTAALSSRDPQAEAQQAMASGQPNIMGYYSGRAGLKTPGLTTEQQKNQRCKLNIIDGLGDVIYGLNHMKYRIAIRDFAKVYNSSFKN